MQSPAPIYQKAQAIAQHKVRSSQQQTGTIHRFARRLQTTMLYLLGSRPPITPGVEVRSSYSEPSKLPCRYRPKSRRRANSMSSHKTNRHSQMTLLQRGIPRILVPVPIGLLLCVFHICLSPMLQPSWNVAGRAKWNCPKGAGGISKSCAGVALLGANLSARPGVAGRGCAARSCAIGHTPLGSRPACFALQSQTKPTPPVPEEFCHDEGRSIPAKVSITLRATATAGLARRCEAARRWSREES